MTKMLAKRFAVVITLIFITINPMLPPRAWAQTTSGKVIGQVLDPAGIGIADAKVTVINENNGNTVATVTDLKGVYIVPYLPPGLYSIKAVRDGYAENGVAGFPVPLNQTSDLTPPNITLQPATTATTTATLPATQVTETVSLINKSNAARQGNFDDRQVLVASARRDNRDSHV